MTTTASDLFGYAVAVGDFDRDRIGDLAIGAPYGNNLGLEVTGYVAVEYGPIDWTERMHVEPRAPGLIQPGARFGTSVTVAHFTGDRHDDLAVGAPGQDVGVINAGDVFVYYGGTRYYFDQAHVFHQDSYHVRDNCEPSDGFGTALSVGDFNDDGLADLVVAFQRRTSAPRLLWSMRERWPC